ncbi:MAG: tRNA guanosine(15) transglycosylase TgtA [Thermoplasmata archaeon]|nr:tRNA guanosine(15) transglycosylase TgtA [Thermoplasmata archaeon]MBE3140636.1 tRNA guanosine(15) transglycosylase TgtA [Thermoplasmata archaeon]
MTFEIKERDAAGRLCKFTTKHGAVTTPNLLPVINPNKMMIPPKEMKKRFGTEILITNSYIIHKDAKLRKQALEQGVHKLIDFSGSIMTDSGTFQSYVYRDVKLDPLEIVRFQRDIGSDIGTILDIFGTPGQTKEEAEQGVKETIARAKKSVPEKGEMLLACTVQGSVYPDLREHCAQQLSALDADFFPIGGVVPLMENQRYPDLVRCILAAKRGLDPSKPVHLFGAGHPLIFPLAVALGCDFFDSSAYAKYANDGRMMFQWGTEKFDDLTELPCCCPVCSKQTASELRELDAKERTLQLALHNLYVSFAEMKTIRAAITGGWLWELVEQRASANPSLYDALRVLREPEHLHWLEHYEPTSKKTALFYTGPQTIHRPTIHRYHTRLFTRYEPLLKTTVVFPEGTKPYSMFYSREIKHILEKKNVNFVVDSHLGPIPFELDEMYPLAQSVFPDEIDQETREKVQQVVDRFLKNKTVIRWDECTTIEIEKSPKQNVDLDMRRISAVADMQFGRGASEALLNGEITIIKSKRTGKIRNIICDGSHVFSMRAEDGLFTLKLDGGRRLHRGLKYPLLRVVVTDDAVPFVKEGKSVFAKFVKDCDPDLRPFDECLIVNENDTLLAVGRTLLNRDEMLAFRHGMAVKTRESVK